MATIITLKLCWPKFAEKKNHAAAISLQNMGVNKFSMSR